MNFLQDIRHKWHQGKQCRGANHNVSVINGNTKSGLFQLWQSAGNVDVSLGGAHGALAAQVCLVPGPRV